MLFYYKNSFGYSSIGIQYRNILYNMSRYSFESFLEISGFMLILYSYSNVIINRLLYKERILTI